MLCLLSSIPYISSVQKPVNAIIFVESSDTTKLSVSQTITLALAPEKLGVRVLDLQVLGKNKQDIKELEPYLLAIDKQQLPVLAMKWASGKITTKPCPQTLEMLKTEIGAK